MSAAKASWAAVLGLGLVVGLYGIRWGLPGEARLRAFPGGRPTPEMAQRFADSWSRLYSDLLDAREKKQRSESSPEVKGVVEIPPDWIFPPEALVNSYRSLLLQAENPDEKKSFIILSRMRPWKLDFEPLYIQYGGAFIYPLGAFLKAAQLLGAVTLVPDIRHYIMHPEDMGGLYLGGRVFMLVFHLGALSLLFLLGRRLGDWRLGAAAACLFALCPIIAGQSHILKPHPYATFWVFAAMLSAFDAVDRARPRDYLLCGLAAGLAVGSALSLIFFLGLPLMVWFGRWLWRRPPGKEHRWAAAGSAAALGVYILTNPYAVFAYKKFVWETQIYMPQDLTLTIEGLFTDMPRYFGQGMGVGLALAALAAAAWALFDKDLRARLAAWVILGCSALVWARFKMLNPSASVLRLYLPLIGLGCLLAARALLKLPRPARLALLSLLLLESGARTWVSLENLRRDATPDSTRGQAADWIEANVPAGAALGLARYPEPSHNPALRYDRYRLVVFDRPEAVDARGRKPEYLAVDETSRFDLDLWIKNNYDLVACFLPFRVGFIAPLDDSSFANSPQYVYRLRR